MSNFERNVANTMLDAADAKTAHEKTRIRQLEDAAAHWEHKYANARQYNRNLEERNQKLDSALQQIKTLKLDPPMVGMLEIYMRDIASAALDMTGASASETPEAMHARIVTETADAIAAQAETFAESKQPDRYAAHHLECQWRKFEGQAMCNCADLVANRGVKHGT